MPTATKQRARREAARRQEEAGNPRSGMDNHGRLEGPRTSRSDSILPTRTKTAKKAPAKKAAKKTTKKATKGRGKK